jgi:hypothetical protein
LTAAKVSGLDGLNPAVADPTVFKAFTAMGTLHDEQKWDKVVEVGDAWLDARGGMNPTAATWYAQALMGVGRYGDAVEWAAIATRHMPKDEIIPRIAAWSTYAQALSRTGQFDRAKRAMASAVSLDADHAQTQEKQGHMLATMALCSSKPIVVRGRRLFPDQLWAAAWELMESRLAEDEKKIPPYFHGWDGETKEPVSVLHEQGLGDAVLVARWIPWLVKTTGHPVTYYGPPTLGPWMREIPGVVLGDFEDTDTRGNAGEHLGAAVRAMSLPYHTHMRSVADLPAPWAPSVLTRQRAYRTRSGPLKVGVCWKGATVGWHDFERSFTAEQFAPIFAPLEGATFVNLAHEAAVPSEAPFHAVAFDDVMHTGHVIADLDLVVTVDTGIAHLAGSLTVPTLVIPPTVPDWRWVWPRGQTTPFYPSVIVVRRRFANDAQVITTTRQVLEMYAAKLSETRAA